MAETLPGTSEASIPGAAVAEWPLPALLRGARARFGRAVREDLEAAGFDDLPPNGPYVLGAVAKTKAPLGDVIRQLAVSKQTAGQLVDTLVTRHYLNRYVDADDRRRLIVELTPRGAEAATVIEQAVARVESGLIARMGSEAVSQARQVLAGLIFGEERS